MRMGLGHAQPLAGGPWPTAVSHHQYHHTTSSGRKGEMERRTEPTRADGPSTSPQSLRFPPNFLPVLFKLSRTLNPCPSYLLSLAPIFAHLSHLFFYLSGVNLCSLHSTSIQQFFDLSPPRLTTTLGTHGFLPAQR